MIAIDYKDIEQDFELNPNEYITKILGECEHFILVETELIPCCEKFYYLANDLSYRREGEPKGKWFFDLKMYDKQTALEEFDEMSHLIDRSLEYIYDIDLSNQ